MVERFEYGKARIENDTLAEQGGNQLAQVTDSAGEAKIEYPFLSISFS